MFSDLQMKVASEAAVMAMHAEMAKINDFTHNFQELEGKKGDAIAVPVINLSAGGNFDESSNNYATASNEVDGMLVNLNKHIVKSVTVTDRELAATDFNWLRDMVYAETEVIGRMLNQQVFGLVGEAEVKLSATLDTSSKTAVASLYATAADNDINVYDSILVLDPTNYAKVLGLIGDYNIYGGVDAVRAGRLPGLFGFKSVICSTFLPEGVKGAIIARDAIGIVSRYLEPMGGAYPAAWKASDDNGFTIGFRGFADLATGRRYLACESLYGTKILDAKRIVKLV